MVPDIIGHPVMVRNVLIVGNPIDGCPVRVGDSVVVGNPAIGGDTMIVGNPVIVSNSAIIGNFMIISHSDDTSYNNIRCAVCNCLEDRLESWCKSQYCICWLIYGIPLLLTGILIAILAIAGKY